MYTIFWSLVLCFPLPLERSRLFFTEASSCYCVLLLPTHHLISESSMDLFWENSHRVNENNLTTFCCEKNILGSQDVWTSHSWMVKGTSHSWMVLGQLPATDHGSFHCPGNWPINAPGRNWTWFPPNVPRNCLFKTVGGGVSKRWTAAV